MEETKREATPGRWLHVELLGHQTITGLATEVEAFGTIFMKVEALCPDGHVVEQKTVNPRTAVYGFNDIAEDKARSLALESCPNQAHPVCCSGCHLVSHIVELNGVCPACGDRGLMRSWGAVTEELPPVSWARWPLVERAGAEPTRAPETQPDTDASLLFNYQLTDDQRQEAVTWALAVHRSKRGQLAAELVPAMPSFLHAKPFEGEDAQDEVNF